MKRPPKMRLIRWGILIIAALLAIQESAYFFRIAMLKFMNPKTTAFMKRAEQRRPIRHRFVTYPHISPYLKEAVVMAEDSRFFEHNGADWQAMEEAIEVNLERKRWARGGSTITQQLAKNLFLSPRKTPWRKFRELILSYELELLLSKQRILELYLNVAEWGRGIFGAEVAAEHYFQKSAAALSPEEAAWLAAILPSPYYYSEHPENPHLQRKIEGILARMGIKQL